MPKAEAIGLAILATATIITAAVFYIIDARRRMKIKKHNQNPQAYRGGWH